VVSARVDERRGRRLKVTGDLRVDGELRVEASGLYLVSVTVDELLNHF
jgi:hypothetical protein